ncbi:hypothetical protein SJAV_11650 [Sulfurisphaera javensis]|uniref:Uncharacterized protein n=1 Tax=Sulfurisphaera javensis TaxID=2049879 RepID=A0AAT9GRF9_9CREN
MSSTTRWIPKWNIINIEIEGKQIEVCYDEITKLYACPYCTPICKKGGIPEQGSYFFNVDDLKEHIKAHKLSLWIKSKKVEEEEEEEKIKVGEEEEEEGEE